jgi:hypothetical protein
MSWQQFKDNVLRQVTPGVSDIDTVANIYATEYDNAIKRGYDTQNNQTVRESTNFELMKSMFKMALQKGQSSKDPYDLVGNMGEGVKAYWSGVIMNIGPAIPVTLPLSATTNLSATFVKVTNFGEWKGDSSGGGDFKLTQQQIEESKQQLKHYTEKLKTATELEKGPTEDKIRTELGKLESGEDFSVPLTGIVSGDETITLGPPAKFDSGTDWPPQKGGVFAGGGVQAPYTPPNFTPNMDLGAKIVAAASADIGVAMETEGEDNGPRVREILGHVNLGGGNAWCASAVTWWWDTAGAERMPTDDNPAWVPNWIAWAKKNGQWSDKPVVGAAIVYDWPGAVKQIGDHIGIVKSIAADGQITTIEGNTTGPNGQGCYEKKAHMNCITGFVWPKASAAGGFREKNSITKKVDFTGDQYTIKGALKPK